MKTEGTESGETRSCEAGDETLSGSLQDRRAVPPSRAVPSAESPATLVDGQVTLRQTCCLYNVHFGSIPLRLDRNTPFMTQNGFVYLQ